MEDVGIRKREETGRVRGRWSAMYNTLNRLVADNVPDVSDREREGEDRGVDENEEIASVTYMPPAPPPSLPPK